MKPDKINILGVEYKVVYYAKPSDVDLRGRESRWGECDFWMRTIRVFDNGSRPEEDIWHTLIHESLHAIGEALHLKILTDDANHEQLDILALALVDTFDRNGWMKSAMEKHDDVSAHRNG